MNLLKTIFFLLAVAIKVNAEDQSFLRVMAGQKCCGCKSKGNLKTGQSCDSSNECESACCTLGKCNPCSGSCYDGRCASCKLNEEDVDTEVIDPTVVATQVNAEDQSFLRVMAGQKCCGCKSKGNLKTGQSCDSSNECESACCTLGKCNPCSGGCADGRCASCKLNEENVDTEVIDATAFN